jgi:hypothetical protein
MWGSKIGSNNKPSKENQPKITPLYSLVCLLASRMHQGT